MAATQAQPITQQARQMFHLQPTDLVKEALMRSLFRLLRSARQKPRKRTPLSRPRASQRKLNDSAVPVATHTHFRSARSAMALMAKGETIAYSWVVHLAPRLMMIPLEKNLIKIPQIWMGHRVMLEMMMDPWNVKIKIKPASNASIQVNPWRTKQTKQIGCTPLVRKILPTTRFQCIRRARKTWSLTTSSHPLNFNLRRKRLNISGGMIRLRRRRAQAVQRKLSKIKWLRVKARVQKKIRVVRMWGRRNQGWWARWNEACESCP